MGKIVCKLCSENKDNFEKCFGCGISGCDDCMKVVCCDCGVYFCDKCVDDDDIWCGCYGTCDECGTDVDRGSCGWRCSLCEKWLCGECKAKIGCKGCLWWIKN
jgi:hypothetical protein